MTMRDVLLHSTQVRILTKVVSVLTSPKFGLKWFPQRKERKERKKMKKRLSFFSFLPPFVPPIYILLDGCFPFLATLNLSSKRNKKKKYYDSLEPKPKGRGKNFLCRFLILFFTLI